jgi:transcriptional regulator with XRE-family HTH domain
MTNQEKRQLEPTYTKRCVHIPRLREKLEWLYGYNPTVKRQKDLARELGVSPATLSSWLNGRTYSDSTTIASVNPDCIPIRYFPKFVDIWALPISVLELSDLTEFKDTLLSLRTGHGPGRPACLCGARRPGN